MIVADTTAFTPFIIPPATEVTIDYELGGEDIGDTSQGLRSKLWQMRVIGDDVILSDGGGITYTLFSAIGITEASVSFDQNMRPVVVYVENEVTKLYWYDPEDQAQVFDVLGSGITSPKASLDDSRAETLNTSQVVISYIKNGFLCVRLQSERYIVENQLLEVDPTVKLLKTGMTLGNRFRWLAVMQSEVFPEASVASTLSKYSPSTYTIQNKILPISQNENAPENSVATSLIAGQTYASRSKTTSGEWVDVAVFTCWLRQAIQKQVFNLLRRVAKPSPVQVENAINVALEAGKQLGGITRYKVTTTNVDVRNRTASFEWKAQLTNAIHSTTISGIVKP